MKAARFKVSAALLRQALHLPATSQIVDAEWSDSGWAVVFTALDPSLPEAAKPHDTVPTITKEEYHWDWGVK